MLSQMVVGTFIVHIKYALIESCPETFQEASIIWHISTTSSTYLKEIPFESETGNAKVV